LLFFDGNGFQDWATAPAAGRLNKLLLVAVTNGGPLSEEILETNLEFTSRIP